MAALLLVMVVVAHLLYHVRAELCCLSDLWVITSENAHQRCAQCFTGARNGERVS
jgi:hypothetical protein